MSLISRIKCRFGFHRIDAVPKKTTPIVLEGSSMIVGVVSEHICLNCGKKVERLAVAGRSIG